MEVYYSVIFVASSLMCLVSSFSDPNSFNYETQNNYKLSGPANQLRRRRLNNVPLFDRASYPEPLPVPKKSYQAPTPYEKIQQGTRQKNDSRVYNVKFSYEPKLIGHQIVFRELLDCIITYICIDTTRGVPIILRGGVGYRYFVAIAKAKPGEQLTGKVKAYCLKNK